MFSNHETVEARPRSACSYHFTTRSNVSAAVLKFKTWMLFADACVQTQDNDNNVEHRHHFSERCAETPPEIFLTTLCRISEAAEVSDERIDI